MAMIKIPVKGMKDILPDEMAVRDYAIGLIKDTYKSFGFTPIDTPSMEHIENLTSKQGGENENLIYKVLKRGEKLSMEGVSSPDDLVDMGMRYDLTVSLCRFYANNQDKLPSPFKALQIGNVWRADQPQKGRFRQFTQCDIDVLGEGSMLTEVDILTATTAFLRRIGFSGFTLRLNHRQLLKAMFEYAGFPPDKSDRVFIILDKMDKIGQEGVTRELLAEGLARSSIFIYMGFFKENPGVDPLDNCEKILGNASAPLNDTVKSAIEDTRLIMKCVGAIRDETGAEFNIIYDPSLVRGMGYYTGPIFEISMDEFGGSVAGGGRYDNLVGGFTNLDVPACGFSIGFERIISILMDKGFTPPITGKKIAFLAERGLAPEELSAMFIEAARERATGATVLVTSKNKNARFQIERLEKDGYTEFRSFSKQR